MELDFQDSEAYKLGEFLKTMGRKVYEFGERTVKVEGVAKDYTETARINIWLVAEQGEKAKRYLTFANKIKEDDLEKILASITEQEKDVGRYFRRVYERIYPALRDLYFKVTGRALPKIDNYFPLIFSKEFISIDNVEELLGATDKLVKGDFISKEELDEWQVLSDNSQVDDKMTPDQFGLPFITTMIPAEGRFEKGFLEKRTGGGIRPLELNAFINFENNIKALSHYFAFIDVLPKLDRMLRDDRVKSILKAVIGDSAHPQLVEWVRYLAPVNPRANQSESEKRFQNVITSAAQGISLLNIQMALKMPVSMFTAFSEIGYE